MSVLFVVILCLLTFAIDFGLVSLAYWLFSLGFGFDFNILVVLAITIILWICTSRINIDN